MLDILKKIAGGVIGLVYPPVCLACGRLMDGFVCGDCVGNLELIKPPICLKCGKPTAIEVDDCRHCSGKRLPFKLLRSVGLHDGTLREVVHSLKYGSGSRAAKYLSALMVNSLNECGFDPDFVTYVPVHRKTISRRGYNQAYLLAKEVSAMIDKPLKDTLIKVRYTVEQNSLTLKERKSNLKDVFKVKYGLDIKGKAALLIDDVYTSGATINEVSKALRQAGINEIMALTVTRAVTR
jgi:ComF family protein